MYPGGKIELSSLSWLATLGMSGKYCCVLETWLHVGFMWGSIEIVY